MKELYCCLRGGLGNQLFQYAYAITLKRHYRCNLHLDLGWFINRKLSHETPRDFVLNYYNIPEPFCYPKYFSRNTLSDFAWRMYNKTNVTCFPFHSDNSPLSYHRLENAHTVYLHGSWQLYEHLCPIKSDLINILSLKSRFFPSPTENLHKEFLSNSSLVSVHIRRGDYLSNPRFAHIYTVPSIDYYMQSFSKFRSFIPTAKFVIFSDDNEWCRQNFSGVPDVYFYDDLDPASCSHPLMDLIQFEAMRSCKHSIMANSSFSWWSSFLSEQINSIVFCPNKWYNCYVDMHKLIPPGWIVV